MTDNRPAKNILPAIIFLLVAAFAAYSFFTVPDRRTTGEKVGEAIDAVSEDMNKSGEKLNETMKEIGEDLKKE